MLLSQTVNRLIIYYPSLFKAGNFEDSRILVLSHLFLTLGNGYSWSKHGYLREVNRKPELCYNSSIPPKFFLPDDFFDTPAQCDFHFDPYPACESAAFKEFLTKFCPEMFTNGVEL